MGLFLVQMLELKKKKTDYQKDSGIQSFWQQYVLFYLNKLVLWILSWLSDLCVHESSFTVWIQVPKTDS